MPSILPPWHLTELKNMGDRRSLNTVWIVKESLFTQKNKFWESISSSEARWKGGTWSELNRTKVYSISKKLNSAKVWVTLYI